MFPEFNLDPPDSASGSPLSPEGAARLEEMLRRRLDPNEHSRLERLLLRRLKERKPRLVAMLEEISGHWTYEDHFYRYYHTSFKVYRTQDTTQQAVRLLRELLPERKLNLTFERIIREGTEKKFELEHNRDWDRHARPMLEAFAHARFMVEMAVRYADLPEPPHPLPNGWAALLYLFDLR